MTQFQQTVERLKKQECYWGTGCIPSAFQCSFCGTIDRVAKEIGQAVLTMAREAVPKDDCTAPICSNGAHIAKRQAALALDRLELES